MDETTAFGFLANALGGGGDSNQLFPQSDAEDMSRGARFIPGKVTLERRAGRQVDFATNCKPCCWYWQLDDGSRIYHYDPFTYEEIGRHNHGPNWAREQGLAGPCPHCGNTKTNGGEVSAEEVAQMA